MALIRQSNIELLRVIATLMILMVHFSGWFPSFLGIESYWEGNTTMAVTRAMLNAISCIGVPLFVLISGYFSIRPKVHSLLNLFTCLAFFYLGTYLLNCWITGDVVFQHHRVLRSLMAFSHENWFVQCYLFLMLLSPILNTFVEKVTEKALLMYILIFMACAFYFGCVHNSTYFYFERGYSVTTFMLIYLVGRYIKLYGCDKARKASSWALAFVWLGTTILICIWKLFLPEYDQYVSYCSPLLIVSASSLFVLFTRMDLQNKFINWLGVSCLASYILHTQLPVMEWMIKADECLLHYGNAFIYCLGGVICVLTIFVVAVLLDKIRLFVCNPIINVIDKNFLKKQSI